MRRAHTTAGRVGRAAAVAVAAAAILGTAAASCSDDSSTTTSTSTTSGSSRSLSISTPAGDASLSLDGQLPPGWPSDFPEPSGAEVAGSGSLVDQGSGVMVGVYSTDRSASDTFAFYSGRSSLSPSDVTSAGVGSAFVGSMTMSGTYDGSVTVAGANGTTYVVVVLDASSTTSTSAGSTSTTTGGGT